MYDSAAFELQGLSRCGLRYSVNNSTNFVLLDSFSESDLESHSTSELINRTLPNDADNNIGIRIEFFNTGADGEWCFIDYVTIYGVSIFTSTPTSNTNIPTMNPVSPNDLIVLYGPDPTNAATLSTNWMLGNGATESSSTGTGYTGIGGDDRGIILEGGEYMYLKDFVKTSGYRNIIIKYGIYDSSSFRLESNEYCTLEYSINDTMNWNVARSITQSELTGKGNSRNYLWNTTLPRNADDNIGISILFRNSGDNVLDECRVDYVVIYGNPIIITDEPTFNTNNPTIHPTVIPTNIPTTPTYVPTPTFDTVMPSSNTDNPSTKPTVSPTKTPTISPSISPIKLPTKAPTNAPSMSPMEPRSLDANNKSATKTRLISVLLILIVVLLCFVFIAGFYYINRQRQLRFRMNELKITSTMNSSSNSSLPHKSPNTPRGDSNTQFNDHLNTNHVTIGKTILTISGSTLSNDIIQIEGEGKENNDINKIDSQKNDEDESNFSKSSKITTMGYINDPKYVTIE